MTLDKLLEKETNWQKRQKLRDLFAELEAAGPTRPPKDSGHYYVRPYLVGAHIRRCPLRNRRKAKVMAKVIQTGQGA